ncbi:hypothetical protein QCA50_004057 [Cerrena zonata]|uniref:Cytochrome P450 n=1 Tax=Cerrena zonata TaxID=2478898 RepID=A0AAW0GKG5_9APHY
MQTAVLISTIFLTTLLLRWLKRVHLPSLPLPPGPTGYPIIGNLLDVPVHMPWKKYRQWCDAYGDIVYFKIFNKQTIVIGSAQAAFDLLEKRSDIYSDRPPNVMHEMLTTTRWNFGNMRYSPEWRNHRREFHQFFHQRKVSVYQPIQLRECRAFLRRALHDPTHLAPKIRTIYAAIILKIVYDMEVTDVYHEFIKTAERVFLAISVAQIPGLFWVEFFPFLRYIPSWVPGTYFKKFAEEHIPMVQKMLDEPFYAVKRNMAVGKASDTTVATLLERLCDEGDKKEDQLEKELFVRDIMGVAYGGDYDN